MTLNDMDICLNVSTSAAVVGAPKVQRSKANFFKPQAKRLARKLLKKDDHGKSTGGVFTKNANTEEKLGTTNVRVKQKSLAAIVAKNVARSKITSNKQITNKPVASEATESKVAASRPQTDKPIVSFVKPTKENALKTILAKSRSSEDGKPKKSLAAIFSGTPSSVGEETKLLQEKPTVGDAPAEHMKMDKFPHARNIIRDERQPHFQGNGRRDNGYRNRNFDKSSAKEPDNKNDKPTYNKPSSKVSSLFGNNPEVPNIGQRFVKPVSEAVFSKTAFSDLGIHPYAISNLEQNMKITNMTTVQQKAIPVILSGRNVLVRSQTGSGKTLAYALPIVESLQRIRPKLMRNSGLKALVVVPTRELALQTYECFRQLVSPFTWIVPGYLIGGEKRKAEKARLRRGCTILVATPGRLLDHYKHTEVLNLSKVKCFVLDEADRMLDMGYEKDISRIVEALKDSETSSTKNGYDPMQLIRNIGKKTSDEKTEAIDTDKDEKSASAVGDEEEVDEDDEEARNKQEYHSGTDSDSDDQEFPIRTKRAKISREKSRAQDARVLEKDADETRDVTEPESTPDSSRQTILLSATLTAAVEKLAGLTMTNPAFVDAAQDNLTIAGGNLSETNEDLVVPQGVSQSYIVTPPKLRMVTLSAYIAGKCQTAGEHKILVFMATQDMIDYHADILSKILGKPRDDDDEDSEPLVDVEFFKLHGSMLQKERTEVFKTFRAARSGVLLCTDVASRGLDMPKVDTVIQYTGPLSARDYVHRIGRTARAGTSGASTIFLTPPEIDFVRMLESRRIRIKQEDMKDVLDKLMGPLSKHYSVEATATALQNEFETLVLENKKFHSQACKAYVSWIRFYASYPRDMREIFNRKDLHLGHYAKSFALRDPPQRIGGIGKTLREKEPAKEQHNNRLSDERPAKQPRKKQDGNAGGHHKPGLLKRSRMLNTSEYGSGLGPAKKSKKS